MTSKKMPTARFDDALCAEADWERINDRESIGIGNQDGKILYNIIYCETTNYSQFKDVKSAQNWFPLFSTLKRSQVIFTRGPCIHKFKYNMKLWSAKFSCLQSRAMVMAKLTETRNSIFLRSYGAFLLLLFVFSLSWGIRNESNMVHIIVWVVVVVVKTFGYWVYECSL